MKNECLSQKGLAVVHLANGKELYVMDDGNTVHIQARPKGHGSPETLCVISKKGVLVPPCQSSICSDLVRGLQKSKRKKHKQSETKDADNATDEDSADTVLEEPKYRTNLVRYWDKNGYLKWAGSGTKLPFDAHVRVFQDSTKSPAIQVAIEPFKADGFTFDEVSMHYDDRQQCYFLRAIGQKIPHYSKAVNVSANLLPSVPSPMGYFYCPAEKSPYGVVENLKSQGLLQPTGESRTKLGNVYDQYKFLPAFQEENGT